MSIVALLECKPRRASDAALQTLRLAWNARERQNYQGVQWRSGLSAPPVFETALGFDGNGFGNGASPTVGQFSFVATDGLESFTALVWKGATVKLWTAPMPAGGAPVDPADGALSVVFEGNAVVGGFNDDGQFAVTMLDPGEILRVPVSANVFGTSGVALLDGADAKEHKGQVVPLGWGELLKIPGRLVDKAHLIYVFLGRAATSVQGFYDGGAPFTLGVARANLAALIANVPASGTVDYCLNDAGLVLARPWSGPTYPFTADLTSGSTKVADIAVGVVAARTALTFVAGVVATHNALQAAPAQLYIDDETTVEEALNSLLAGVGAWWKLSATGTIELRRWAFAAPIATFPAHKIGSITRRGTVMPTGRRTLGYAHIGKVHGDGEIAKSLLWENVVGVGKPVSWRIRCRGYNGALPGGDVHTGLWNEDTQTQIAGMSGMYSVAVWNGSGWVVNTFDTLVNPMVTSSVTGTIMDARSAMGYFLANYNNNTPGSPVVVWTYDEPFTSRLGGAPYDIATQMFRAGASRAVFAGSSFTFRAAYVLVGTCGGGEGSGAEYLAGANSSPATAFIDVVFTMTNGILAISGKTVSLAQDLVFADGITIEADRTAQAALIGSALSGAANAQATADGKIDTFYQASPPAGTEGDLWFDTDDGYRQYRFSGSSWGLVSDTRIGIAITAAAGAQATADGKVTTFTGEAAPTAGAVGDLWYKPSTKALTRWSGSAWTAVSAIGVEDGATVGATAAQITAIGAALTAGTNAQATADGKIDTFYQASPPAGTEGDLWFDTDDGYRQYRFSGSSWSLVSDTRIGVAISAAAGAQATADGKVTTFTGEAAPTAGAVGDLWYKPSTKALTRWSGAAWQAVSATGVADGADVTAPVIAAGLPSSTPISGTGKTLGQVTTAAFTSGGGASPPVAIPFGTSGVTSVNGAGSVTVQFNGTYGGAGTGNLTLAVQMQIGSGGWATLSGGTFTLSGLNAGDSAGLAASTVAFDTGGPLGAIRCILTASGSHSFTPVYGDSFYYVG